MDPDHCHFCGAVGEHFNYFIYKSMNFIQNLSELLYFPAVRCLYF